MHSAENLNSVVVLCTSLAAGVVLLIIEEEDGAVDSSGYMSRKKSVRFGGESVFVLYYADLFR